MGFNSAFKGLINILMVVNITLTAIRVQKHSQDGDRFSKCTLEEWGHAAGSAVGCGTALQAGRSRVR